MNDETKNTPDVEPVGETADKGSDALETLRSDVEEMKKSLKEEIVGAFGDELKKLSQPNRDRAPEPDIKRDDNRATPGIRVTGHASDPLYATRSAYEQTWRSPQTDQLAQRWASAVFYNDREQIRRYERELNDLVRADEVTEGLADSNAGVGTGTGAPLIPVPLSRTISEQRNRVAKIRQRAQVFTSPNQTLRIPTSARAVAQMVAEGASATNFPSGLGTVLLSKKKMQTRFAVTMEMLEDSPFNLVSHLIDKAGRAMGQLEDEVFLNVRPGDGAAAITRPVEAIAGEIQVSPTLTGRVGYPDVSNLAFSMEEQYARDGWFLGNRSAMKLLSGVTDADGRPIFSPSIGAPQVVGDQILGQVGSIFGRPVLQLPFTTSGTDSNLVDIWFADLQEFAILDGGGFRVEASDHVEFDSDTRVWKITQRLDAHPLNQDEAWARLAAVSGTNNVGLTDTFV